MNKLKIALLQLFPTHSIASNLAKGIEACNKAKELGADLALFPEMWQIGYDDIFMTPENAIDHNSYFIQQYMATAKKLKMAIAITYLGKSNSKPTNNVAIIDQFGNIILDYAKVHICNFPDGIETSLAPGEEFKVAELHYTNSTVKIGAMICFDREFPESARALMLKGAEIIITPNSCPLHNCMKLGDTRLAAFRTRAFENMVGVAMTNYPSPKNDGHSCAYNVNGKQLILAGTEEEIAICEFDLDFIRKWRKKEVWGDKYIKLITQQTD